MSTRAETSIKKYQKKYSKTLYQNAITQEPAKTTFRKNCFSASNPKRNDKLPPLHATIETKTQLDLDPKFYSIVGGQPIKQNHSIRLYKENLRNIAVTGVTRGFILDEILRIDRETETERAAYEVASKHFDEYKNSFEKFLAHDNDQTMKVIKQCDNTAKELALTNENHKKLHYEMATLKSNLQYMDESRLILIAYKNFLHNISPLWWQEKNEVGKKDEQAKPLIVVSSDIFCEIKPLDIQQQLERCQPPILYFESPNQLVLVFETLEKQNLNYLLMTEEMNAHLMKVFRGTEYLKQSWKQEISTIQQQMDTVESSIASSVSREEKLKEVFFKILKEKLQHLIASETALQLYYYVQYVYENIITKNEVNLPTIDLVHALEKEYNDMMFELDGIDLNIVKEIEKDSFTDDLKTMQEAKHAKKLLENFEKIRKRLGAAFDPYNRKKY